MLWMKNIQKLIYYHFLPYLYQIIINCTSFSRHLEIYAMGKTYVDGLSDTVALYFKVILKLEFHSFG